MALIVQTFDVMGKGSNGAVDLVRTTKLSGADTFTYYPGTHQYMHIFNSTGGAKVITFVGSAPTPINPSGYGETVSTAAGKAVTVPADGWTILHLDDIWAFLSGDGLCTATGGFGCYIALYN